MRKLLHACCTHVAHKNRENMRPSHYSSCQSCSVILKMVNKQAHQEYRNIILGDTVKYFFHPKFQHISHPPELFNTCVSFIPLCTKWPTSNIQISGIILGIHIELPPKVTCWKLMPRGSWMVYIVSPLIKYESPKACSGGRQWRGQINSCKGLLEFDYMLFSF